MDYSKFRRAPIEQQTPEELQATIQALQQMSPDQQLSAMSGDYMPNYPVQAMPEQLANPMAQSMGIKDILAALLLRPEVGEPLPFDQRFPGPGDLPTRGSSSAPLPRPRPK